MPLFWESLCHGFLCFPALPMSVKHLVCQNWTRTKRQQMWKQPKVNQTLTWDCFHWYHLNVGCGYGIIKKKVVSTAFCMCSDLYCSDILHQLVSSGSTQQDRVHPFVPQAPCCGNVQHSKKRLWKSEVWYDSLNISACLFHKWLIGFSQSFSYSCFMKKKCCKTWLFKVMTTEDMYRLKFL